MAGLFHLPLAPADLLRSGGPAQYVVQEVLAPAQVAGQLAEFQRAFQVQGPLAILQHFDTLYSLLHDAYAFSPPTVVSRHSSDLSSSWILCLNPSDRTTHLSFRSLGRVEGCRISFITPYFPLSLVTGSCYRILEKPSISHQKHRAVREAVMHLLAVALTHYDHMLSATLKISQMLQHFEHVAPVFAGAVSLWATEYGMKSMVGELLREIGQKCPQDLTRDASGVKGCAAFLTELAEQIPAIVLSNMSVLLHHLDGESYVMRNAILTAMAEMLLQVLSGDQLEEAARGTRDQFLDTLQTHLCDVNGFVRSRVLQLFTRIVQRKVNLCVRRLGGWLQTALLLSCFFHFRIMGLDICIIPFLCPLFIAALITPEEEWEAMQPELRATIHQLLHPLQGEEEEETLEVEETALNTAERIIQLLRKLNYKHAIRLTEMAVCHFHGMEPFTSSSGLEGDKETMILGILRTLYTGSFSEPAHSLSWGYIDTNTVEVKHFLYPFYSTLSLLPTSELVKQEMLVQYLQDAHGFSMKITEALSMVSRMMYESSVSVVQEAIEFFVTVSQFGVPQALHGVQRMLPLIWSKEPGIRETVLSAYRRLYLNPSGDSERSRAESLVRSLSLLMVDASLGTIQCLGEIISEFVQKDEIKPSVVNLLWEQFTEKSQCSALERCAAVMLLGMMTRGKPEIVGSNLDVLVMTGLDEKVIEDYRLAQEVCSAISKLGKNHAPFRLPQTHQLFRHLSEAVTTGFAQPSTLWIPFTESAITLIYQLAEGPEEICAQILQCCSQQALERVQDIPGGANTLPTFLLTHLLSLVGNVALQQVVHLERAVSAELRRRRVLGEEQEAKKHSAENETTVEEDLGLVGASADDTEAELIRNICDTELLDGKQLLSAFIPLVLKICNNPGLYNDPALSAAAALALGKLCMVSAEFCDSHLRLLFTMLEKSTLPGVRSNLMIAAGDLAIRFPNLVEPWTPHLYARLRDPCQGVRQTAGLVMTHLILKDMVKVKGQVSEMAALLIDPEEEIVGLAQNFFSELSNKGNAIYNLLPDIISRLSDPDCGVEEESFRTIMRQLFSYITKDKQTESLVEKLCQRFRTARTERQYRDLSHCLTLLPLSERGLRKMQDNFDCFADKLHDLAVYNCFLAALGRLRRSVTRPETKASQSWPLCSLLSCNPSRAAVGFSPLSGIKAPHLSASLAGSCRRPMSIANRDADSSFITPQPRVSRRCRGAALRHSSRKAAITFSSDEENSPEDGKDSVHVRRLWVWGKKPGLPFNGILQVAAAAKARVVVRAGIFLNF
uniref:Condensin complex subunit 1 n=1 Tax=Chelonoidis abingdonii TaxID=106734 RepID=A0A8C0J688_CHEAB